MRLKDRVAIITGSGMGIGKATALEFAKEGAAVVVCDVNKEAAQEVADEIKSLGSRAKVSIIDVTSEEQVNKMVRSVLREFGKIDILVNNVGGGPRDFTKWFIPFHECNIDDFREFVEINLFSTAICTKAVLKSMIARKYGKIVNVSSIISVFGMTKGSGYAAGKAGVEAFTASIAKEVAPFGINVNCIMPGLAETPAIKLWLSLDANAAHRKELCDWSHFGRLGQPEEFGKVILFLASDDASFMSGTTVPVEGGVLKFKGF